MEELLLTELTGMNADSPIVGDVRAVGLLGAVELVEDPETNKRFSPDLKVAAKVIEALHERGVICRAVTYEGTDIICFSPPLTINKEQIKTLVEKVYQAISSVEIELGKIIKV